MTDEARALRRFIDVPGTAVTVGRMVESPEGEWVRFQDVAAALSAARQDGDHLRSLLAGALVDAGTDVPLCAVDAPLEDVDRTVRAVLAAARVEGEQAGREACADFVEAQEVDTGAELALLRAVAAALRARGQEDKA